MSRTTKRLVILSGAGISAESGIATLRDANGLWEGHDIMEVASPVGWQQNPAVVLEFYNQRRRQLHQVFPNDAHQLIKKLEEVFEVCIVTQNVDDLHERAGSTKVIHLHGELLKAQSTIDSDVILDWQGDIHLGDRCVHGGQLRPYIVWFGEDVPKLMLAAREVEQADIIIVIGTSMQVYPAAGLIEYAKPHTDIYYIDPNPALNYALRACERLTVIESTAQKGMHELCQQLMMADGAGAPLTD